MMSSVIPSVKYSCPGSPLILVKGRTAMDAFSGSGSAGRGSRSVQKRLACLTAVILAHRANEAEAFALERLYQMLLLSAVANCAAGHVQARRHRGVGDDAALPDGRDQVILADDAISVTDQIEEKVEDLGERR